MMKNEIKYSMMIILFLVAFSLYGAGKVNIEAVLILEMILAILVFKWNEEQIKTKEVLEAFGKCPLFGDKRSKTRWLVFMKD